MNYNKVRKGLKAIYASGGPIKRQNLLAGMMSPEQVAAAPQDAIQRPQTKSAMRAAEQVYRAETAAKKVADIYAQREGYADAADKAFRENAAMVVADAEANNGEIRPYDGTVTDSDRTPNAGMFASSTPQENRRTIANLALTAGALTPGVSPFVMGYLGTEGVDSFYNAGRATAGGNGNVLTRFGNYAASPEGAGNLAAMYFGARAVPAMFRGYMGYANPLGNRFGQRTAAKPYQGRQAESGKTVNAVLGGNERAEIIGAHKSPAAIGAAEKVRSLPEGRIEQQKPIPMPGETPTIVAYEGPIDGDYSKPYWWTRNFNIEFNPNYTYEKGTPEEIADTRRWLKDVNLYFRNAYPKIDLSLSEYPKKAEDVVKARLEQHNTFLRGTRDFYRAYDVKKDAQKATIEAMRNAGLDNTEDNRYMWAMTRLTPQTGRGRSGFSHNENDGTLYTSNSMNTATAYASEEGGTGPFVGRIGVVQRPYKLSDDRNNWIYDAEFHLGRTEDPMPSYYNTGLRIRKQEGNTTNAKKSIIGERVKEYIERQKTDDKLRNFDFISARLPLKNKYGAQYNFNEQQLPMVAEEPLSYGIPESFAASPSPDWEKIRQTQLQSLRDSFVDNINSYLEEHGVNKFNDDMPMNRMFDFYNKLKKEAVKKSGKATADLIKKYGSAKANAIIRSGWGNADWFLRNMSPAAIKNIIKKSGKIDAEKMKGMANITNYDLDKYANQQNYPYLPKTIGAKTTEKIFYPTKSNENLYQHYIFYGEPNKQVLNLLGYIPESEAQMMKKKTRAHKGVNDPRFSHKTRVLPWAAAIYGASKAKEE